VVFRSWRTRLIGRISTHVRQHSTHRIEIDGHGVTVSRVAPTATKTVSMPGDRHRAGHDPR
jgi:hypothetical protein